MLPHPLVTVFLIVTKPADTPVTTPASTPVPSPLSDELHTPPAVALAKVIVLPSHTAVAPLIAATVGNGFTVTRSEERRVGKEWVTVYVIVTGPADTPVTTPAASTVATALSDELYT